ncbi:MAG: hypothetical protein LBU83_00460 [Bacteroidales bacterium]|nr:hypothetical protein [Bacteroidales bacterium]
MSIEMSNLIKLLWKDRERIKGNENSVVYLSLQFDKQRQRLENLEKKEKYFISNLYNTPNFEKSEDFKKLEQVLPELAINYKRTVVVFQVCKEFFAKNDISKLYRLDKNVLAKVIERYIEDLGILKKRHGCRKVQLPKIAGLMTNLIVKYRPIIPVDIRNNPYLNINETFAIFHAVCICADFSGRKGEIDAFGKSPQHDEFYEDMIYHLNRNFTPESLIMIFKTLCLYQFRSFLKEAVSG